MDKEMRKYWLVAIACSLGPIPLAWIWFEFFA
jgi:hypothetical protein